LKAEGVKFIFGIPGGLLHPFFEAIEDDDNFRLIMTKHEEGAAFMADGVSRTTRQVAVCAGTSGPGATNLITGVACAFTDGVPMIVITGQASSKALGKGAAQETNREDVDIVEMFRPITKYSAMVTSADSVSRHLRRAMRLALSGRPGPVHLNFPVDLWLEPLSETWFDPKTYRTESRTFDREQVHRAGDALLSAKFPVFLAGSGVFISSAKNELQQLAELIPVRVATTPRAKGIFPEDHPLSLGVFGFAGHKLAKNVILGSEVDVLFTVGASLNETTTMNWHPDLKPSKTFIQLDIDPDRIGRNYPVDIPILGDAKAVLQELIEYIKNKNVCSSWSSVVPPPIGHGRYDDHTLRMSDQYPLTPQRWRVDLQDVLPENAIIFSDIGGHMLFNMHHLCIKSGQQFVLNLGFGSMGHGTVAPIGAALANANKTIVAIVGDGCFTMNGLELLTASEYKVPVIWIVENNNMHGITWHGSRLVGNRKGLNVVKYNKPIKIADMAKAMGLNAIVVERFNEIQDAFMSALMNAGPTVIEVLIDSTLVPPLGDRAKSISGFIKPT
jgi:acetolactate synthase-1/2/3 large subunit